MKYVRVKVLNIDAWRDDCGWYWNESFHVKTARLSTDLLNDNRRLLSYLRTFILNEASKGKVLVDRSSDGIIEIQARHQLEPVVALVIEREEEEEQQGAAIDRMFAEYDRVNLHINRNGMKANQTAT